MFTISINRTQRLVELKLTGLMDLAEVAAMEEAVAAELANCGLRAGQFVQLNEGSEFPIQSQDVYVALNEVGNNPDILPCKLALVSGASPGRMQARRLNLGCESRLFDTRAEALVWLLSDVSSEARGTAGFDTSFPAPEHRSAA